MSSISWEQRKLGDIADGFDYGLNAAATEFDGKNNYLRITDIDDDTHFFKTDDLTSPNTDLSKADSYKLSEGDVLFARTGASVGKTYKYKTSDGKVYFAGFLIRAKIKPEYDASFVYQNTLTDKYCMFIRVTSMRSGQPGVNAQEYQRFEIMAPPLQEQKKLGAFFANLDRNITLHQRKVKIILLLKKQFLGNSVSWEISATLPCVNGFLRIRQRKAVIYLFIRSELLVANLMLIFREIYLKNTSIYIRIQRKEIF